MSARCATIEIAVLALAIGLVSAAPAEAAPGIALEVTVAPSTDDAEMDGDLCGTETSLTVSPGDAVVFCYRATNTGDVDLTTHSLVDTLNGSILVDFPFTLAPSASVFVTQTVSTTQTVTNPATWLADGPGGPAAAAGAATVTIGTPEIALRITLALATGNVEIDGGLCGPTDAIDVSPGTAVVFCYEVENTGEVQLDRHDLTGDVFGAILSDFSFTLEPGADAFLTQTTNVTSTTTEMAAWTARNEIDPDVAALAVGTAVVTVPEPGAAAAALASGLALVAWRRARVGGRRTQSASRGAGPNA